MTRAQIEPRLTKAGGFRAMMHHQISELRELIREVGA